MVNEEIYGCDYCSCGGVTSTGDIMVVDGLDNARQAIKNELLTRQGTYPSISIEYGSRIYDILGEDLTKPTLDALSVHISNALYKQERVKNIIEINPYVTIDKKLKANIKVELVNGSEETINLTIED